MERSQIEIKEEEGRAITSYKNHNSRPQVKTLNEFSLRPHVPFLVLRVYISKN